MATPIRKETRQGILTTVRQPIDGSHPVVQELVEMEYSLERSVEAVEHCGTVEASLDYLLATEELGEIFKPSSSITHEPLEEVTHVRITDQQEKSVY